MSKKKNKKDYKKPSYKKHGDLKELTLLSFSPPTSKVPTQE